MKTFKILLSIAIVLSAVVLTMVIPETSGFAYATAGALAMRDRQIFNKLLKDYKGAIPSPSYLRVEQVLNNSKGSYEYRLLKTDNESATEVKLDRNDVFVVTDLAIYLLREETAKEGIGVLQTFVNQTVFAAVAGFAPTHLETIYNGKLELKIASRINIENMPLQHFRVVPETQQSAATNLSKSTVEMAKYPLGTLLVLKGTADIRFNITFPTFADMQIASVTAGYTHKLVLHPYGYLLRGAATNM